MDLYKLGINESQNKLQLGGFEFSLEQLVQKIVEYKDRSEVNLFMKMNSDYIISMMGKDYLQELERKFADSGNKTMGIVQFIYTFLNLIPHNEEETLFLSLGLIDLFKGICESLNMAQEVKFSDITTAICDRVTTQFEDEYKIKTRNYPPERRFTEQVEGCAGKTKKIDFKAPIVYENNLHNSLKRLHKGKFQTDSTFHNKQTINHGIFAKDMRKLITLDSLDDKLAIYDLNCNLVKHINLKNKEDDSKLDIIIFGIAWSEKQQRIGAVLKNFTLSFWDAVDDFEFEKNFSVHGYTQDYQNNIWYLEKHDMWVTTDSKNGLYSWDIANENTTFCLQTPQIQGAIFQVIELPQIDFCAVGSLDKKVSIWNFYKQILLFQIEVGQVGVHSIAFSNAFQVLLTAGYENNIQLYTIDEEYLDSTLIGKLRGHSSMISTIQVIEKTPMVISADDLGVVRLWDIRNQSCIQSYECSNSQIVPNSQTKKMNIQLILDMFSEGMVAFIGSRINLVNFDEKEEIIKSFSQVENLFPFKVENNTIRDELIVCTRKNISFYDMNTGKPKFTFDGLMENAQDEITVFKQVNQGQNFLLGNQKGQLSIHSYQQNGERVKVTNSHTNEVTQLKIDYINKLLISGGWDSTIRISKLSDNSLDLKRKVENVHNEKGVSILEVSVYHNVVFSATQNLERVFIYDYEYGRLLNYIEFKKKTEPTALNVIQGYPILIVATSENNLYIIHFTKKENKVKFDLLGVINVPLSEQNFTSMNERNSIDNEVFITKQKEEDEPIQNNSSVLYQQDASRLSVVQQRPRQSIFNGNNSIVNSDFQNAYDNTQARVSLQLEMPNFQENYSSGDATTRTDRRNSIKKSNQISSEAERETQVIITKILPDFEFNEKNELVRSMLYCSNTKGFITAFDLTKIFQYYDDIPYQPHSNTRMNYNPHRNSTEDFKASSTRISDSHKRFSETTELTTLFQKQQSAANQQDEMNISRFINSLVFNYVHAHKEVITSMSFVSGDKQRIMTSSQDYYVRIWDKDSFDQLCSLNINHPLPIQWDYKSDHYKKSQKKVLFALRILDLLDKKYNNGLKRKEESSTKIINFLKKLMGIKRVISKSKEIFPSLPSKPKIKDEDGPKAEENLNEEQNDKVHKLTMSDYYSPRDIKYEDIKHFYKNELLGPSLKRLEINKRVAIAQQIWKKPKLTKEEEKEKDNIKKLLEFHVKSDERETIINFLDPEFRSHVIKKGYHNFEDDFSKFTMDLQNKLEFYEYSAAKKAKNNKLRTQNSNMSVNILSQTKLQVPQSGKKQHTQTSQQNQMNQTSRPSIMTELSVLDQKSMPISPSTQNIEPKKRMSILFKNAQTQSQQNMKPRGLKTKQTLTLQLDTIKDISQNNSQAKLSHTQLQPLSPVVKEPLNFENLLSKQNNSPKIPYKTISLFPDSQETKIRVDAFPQTAAKLQQTYNKKNSEIDQVSQANMTSYLGNNKSSFGINSDFKNKRSQDVYKYAQEKHLMGVSNNSTIGLSNQTACSASQIIAASSNKLHQILNGINSKLMKSKKFGILHNNNMSSTQISNTNNNQQTKSSIDYEIIRQTEQDPFSQQSSQRSIFQKNLNNNSKKMFGTNTSASLNDLQGFNNTTSFHIDRHQNKTNYGSNTNNNNNNTTYLNKQNDDSNNYFSMSTMHKNRSSLPSIIINKK